MSSSGMGRDVHSLMLSIQHFLCRPQRRAPLSGFGEEAVVECDASEPCELACMYTFISSKAALFGNQPSTSRLALVAF